MGTVQRINAQAVAFRRDEDLASEGLVFAEHADGSGRTVELQRGLTETEEDRRSGLFGYCVVIDGGQVPTVASMAGRSLGET